MAGRSVSIVKSDICREDDVVLKPKVRVVKMRMLGEVSTGRDNNLNLLRVVAALAVLVSHSWPIALGAGTAEPLSQSVGQSLGTLAVMVFFAISGFLITASFERSGRVSFLIARALRIFPGLLVSLVLVAFVMGPIATDLPVRTYFSMPEPYVFTIRNFLLFFNVYELPGVFEDQPFTAVVGSIWTLKHEVLCYASVFILGILGIWATTGRASAALAIYALVWLLYGMVDPGHWFFSGLHKLSFPFAVGIAFYIWRAHLPLSILGIVLSVGAAIVLKDTVIYHASLSVAIAYTTFWLAYVPDGRIRAYNRLGDYSYGIYIYAFPIQGLVVWIYGAQSALDNILYATPPTILLAIFSWHLIEEPSLRMRHALTSLVQSRPSVTRRSS